MAGRQVLLYFAWSRPGETGAPIEAIDDRFPAIFELRRLLYPRMEKMADPGRYDQGIAGFLDHVQKRNFAAFIDQATTETGRPVIVRERVDDDGTMHRLSDELLAGVDTLIVIGFDSLRTQQMAGPSEVDAVRRFLGVADHLAFVCAHHDIGETDATSDEVRIAEQAEAWYHHGDRALPGRQAFGGFPRSLLSSLGIPALNRYGLRPAAQFDGTPQPIEAARELDRLGLLAGVETFNLHPHLPHFERVDEGRERLDVLARQAIDRSAPSHPFVREGHATFDALLQSRADVFAGTVLVGDTTLWSSTTGGLGSLRRLWSNVVTRGRR
jgi:hypothetical protein